ncbi:hypothetical protein AK88_01857 [Plasmodium fragile]|uniref:Schizont-infected cell agglutination extracellular alpha domain-containing protein n=1 Tax=Plasmodium fragile TaxID=5857 RepID=A0A0D9QMT5_PLAFR|nr:uncharacterized protein AK88_01857 [Plasmodium fragile]KJP88405.1 hypothetical protein AK88_01857 [Plasmodium fragile]
MKDMEPLMDALGSNCNNAGWQHWLTDAKYAHVGQNEGDRIACKFMTIALYFLKGWSQTGKIPYDEKENDMKLKGYMRCAVVHMFTDILFESVCRSKWGTFYAWYSVDGMMKDGGITRSAGTQKCAMDRLMDITRGNWSMSEEIKERLRNNDRLKSMIAGERMKAACQKKIRKEQTKENRPLDEQEQTNQERWEINVKEKLNKRMKKVLNKVERARSGKGQHDTDETDSDEEETLSETDEADEKDMEIEDGKYTNSNNTNMNTHTHGTNKKSKEKNEKSDGAISTPVVPPKKPDAPQADAAPKTSTTTQTPGHGQGSGDKSKDVPEGHTEDAGQDTEKDSWSKDGAGAQSTEAPASAPSESTPTAPSRESGAKGTTGASGSPAQDGETGPSGPAGKHGEPGNSGGGSVIDGGNDEPPPLNPPKPKPPTTSPTQSGSSGSFSDADLADGVPGGAGKGGGDGTGTVSTGDFSGLDLHTPGAAGTGNPGGSHALWTPSDGLNGQPAQSGPLPGPEDKIPGETTDGSGPYPPDLTGVVLTATTPILLFVASVIVAVLGYSLWKASTLGTSWGNLTSHYDTTDVISTLSLSDGPDSAKLDPLNFYDDHATGSPVKNSLFDDMHRNLKFKVKVKKPQHKKKTMQDITAGSSCRRSFKKWTRCKMGRRAWMKVIVVFSVLYTFFISPVAQAIYTSFFGLSPFISAAFMGSFGPLILIVIIYLFVLVRFCRSKTGKCVLDKI